MRKEIYDRLMMMQASRRGVLKSAAGAGALALGSSTVLSALGSGPASAQDNLRTEILKDSGRRPGAADRCRFPEGR